MAPEDTTIGPKKPGERQQLNGLVIVLNALAQDDHKGQFGAIVHSALVSYF
jgi:hypothetical protein